MKVIFLDIDGILNSRRYLEKQIAGTYRHLNPKKLEILREVVEQSGAKIVLSSSWRELFREIEPIEPAAQHLLDALLEHGLGIWDMTPIIGGDRPQEIRHWLRAHPVVKSYVILDDKKYMWGDLSVNWVRTDCRYGLTSRTAQIATAILNE